MEKSLIMKVLLVDDHPLVRAGFERILVSDKDIQIIGEAEDGASAYAMYVKNQPDVVVMDLNMPAKSGGDNDAETNSNSNNLNSGLEAIRRIISYDAKAKILVLTAVEADPFPSHVINAGARGFLTKRCAPDELLTAIKTIYEGNEYLPSDIRSKLSESSNVSPEEALLRGLTKRELQIFTLLAEGKTVTDTAKYMYLSPKTVHAHRANILRKLKIKNNSELIHLAVSHNIIKTY